MNPEDPRPRPAALPVSWRGLAVPVILAVIALALVVAEGFLPRDPRAPPVTVLGLAGVGAAAAVLLGAFAGWLVRAAVSRRKEAR